MSIDEYDVKEVLGKYQNEKQLLQILGIISHIYHLNITIYSVSLSGNIEKIDFLNYKDENPNRHIKILKHMKNLYLLYNESQIIQNFFNFQKHSFRSQKSQSSRNKKTNSSKVWGKSRRNQIRKQQSNHGPSSVTARQQSLSFLWLVSGTMPKKSLM